MFNWTLNTGPWFMGAPSSLMINETTGNLCEPASDWRCFPRLPCVDRYPRAA